MATVGQIEFSHPTDALAAVTVSPDLGAWSRSLNLLTDAGGSNQAGTTIIAAKRGQMFYTWSMVLSDLTETEYLGLLALVRYSNAGYASGVQSPVKFLDKCYQIYPMAAPHEKTLIDSEVLASGPTTGFIKCNAVFDGATFEDSPITLNKWRATLSIREIV